MGAVVVASKQAIVCSNNTLIKLRLWSFVMPLLLRSKSDFGLACRKPFFRVAGLTGHKSVPRAVFHSIDTEEGRETYQMQQSPQQNQQKQKRRPPKYLGASRCFVPGGCLAIKTISSQQRKPKHWW